MNCFVVRCSFQDQTSPSTSVFNRKSSGWLPLADKDNTGIRLMPFTAKCGSHDALNFVLIDFLSIVLADVRLKHQSRQWGAWADSASIAVQCFPYQRRSADEMFSYCFGTVCLDTYLKYGRLAAHEHCTICSHIPQHTHLHILSLAKSVKLLQVHMINVLHFVSAR